MNRWMLRRILGRPAPGACLAVEWTERAGPMPAVVALPEWVPAFQIERVVRAQSVQSHAWRSFAGHGGLIREIGRSDRVHGHHATVAKDVETT